MPPDPPPPNPPLALHSGTRANKPDQCKFASAGLELALRLETCSIAAQLWRSLIIVQPRS